MPIGRTSGASCGFAPGALMSATMLIAHVM
jgi:hypothetical protein